MGNGIRVKHNHVLQNLNRKRFKSGEKYKKAMGAYLNLLKREKNFGPSKWIENAKKKALSKIDKYGINNSMLEDFFVKKGFKDLLPK